MMLISRFVLAVVFFNQVRLFKMPDVSIRPITPRKLKVVLPYTDGDAKLGIHVNINRPIGQDEEGEISGETSVPKRDKWILVLPVSLNVGDLLYYCINVHRVRFGKLQNFTRSGYYEVTGFKRNTEDNETYIESSLCQKVLVNLTGDIQILQQELASLQETNQILLDVVQKNPTLSTHHLTLQGLENEANFEMIVHSVVQEKLGLNVKIENVVLVANDRVQFDVDSFEEKLRIIKAAKSKLKNSRFRILY